MDKKNFSYEEFCKYVTMKMGRIHKNNKGENVIIVDTQPLMEFGLMTEDETLRHIYDNNLFEEMEKIILLSNIPYDYIESYKKVNSHDNNKDKLELNQDQEDEDEWDLEL